MAEELEVPSRVGSEEILSETHYPAIPLEKAMVALPIVGDISSGYQPSKQLAAAPSSLDSIEMELREYMDNAMTNANEFSLPFEYEGETPWAASGIFEFYHSHNDEDESSVRDLLAWPPDGYERMNVYHSQPLHPGDFTGPHGLEVEQEEWNGSVDANGMAGFSLYDKEIQDEDDLNDSEYASFYDLSDEDIQYDITARQDADSSSQPNGTVRSVEDEYNDDGGSALLTQRFSQGRAILLGISAPGIATVEGFSRPVQTVSHAEAAVAKALREHWLPQKF
jgi:hypothetical protein